MSIPPKHTNAGYCRVQKNPNKFDLGGKQETTLLRQGFQTSYHWLLTGLVLGWLLPTQLEGLPHDLGSLGEKSIRQERIRARVKFLASSHFKGRASGSPEAELTVRYIASIFEGNGLIPAPHFDEFIHSFRVIQAIPQKTSRFELVRAEGSVVSFKREIEYLPASWGPDASIQAKQAVFVGYGVCAPVLDYDDYRGVDVRDKVAIMLSGVPPETGFRRIGSTDYSDPVEKSLEAAARGAAGVVIILFSDKKLPSPISKFRDAKAFRSNRLERLSIPVLRMTFSAGERLTGESERGGSSAISLRDLQNRINQTGRPYSIPLDGKIRIQVAYRRRRFQGFNVMAQIPGSDPTLKDEFIVVGAHHDHMGSDKRGRMFFGADDNASGTTALLELSEAFQRNPKKPKRSILLVTWGAEEIGLLGSRHYVSRPAVPFQQTVAMFQMDMIGRDAHHAANLIGNEPSQREEDNKNSLNVFGASIAPMLRTHIERSNTKTRLDLRFPSETNAMALMRRSDHWPFLKQRIPVLFLFTGFHPDYHQTTDTADKINFGKLEKIIKLIYEMVWEVGETNRRPRVDSGVFEKLTHHGPADN